MPRLAPLETRTDIELQRQVVGKSHGQLLTFVDVRREQLMAAHLLGYRNPYATACAKMLMSRCFAGGMHITKGDVDVSDQYADSTHDYWTSLLQDAAMHLFMFGFCVVRRQHPELGPAAIISPLDLRVQVRYIRGSSTYRIYDTLRPGFMSATHAMIETPMDDVIVFDTHTPMSDGSLRSHFSSMFETYGQLQLINDSAVLIYRRGASPTVLTEQAAPKGETDNERDIAYANDRSLSVLQQRQLIRNPEEHIKAQEDLRRVTRIVHENVRADSASEIAVGASLIQLPLGQSVSHVLPSAQPPDVREFMDYVGEQMAIIFGIPPMWKLPARQSGSNDAVDELLHAAFESTTRLLKAIAEVLLADSNREQGFLNVLNEAGDDPDEIDDALIAKEVFHVSFPGVVSIENIKMLREMGLLDHEKLRSMVASALRITEDRLSDEAFDLGMDMPVAKRVKREDDATREARKPPPTK